MQKLQKINVGDGSNQGFIPWYTFNQALIDNPYRNYEAIRAIAPIIFSQERREWFVTDYNLASMILRDAKRFSSNRRIALAPGEKDTGGASLVLLSDDPPKHTRHRALISSWFTSLSVKSLRPFVEASVDSICNFNKAADFAQELAIPLPVMAAAKLLGVKPSDWPMLSAWSQIGVGTKPMDSTASYKMFSYFRKAIQERRISPDDGLISFLLVTSDDEGYLSDMDVLKFCILILTAGSETTSNLLGNMFNFLSLYPEVWEQLKGNHALIGAFTDEMLRYESPIQFFSRVVTMPSELDGHSLEPGDEIVLCAGAANRDPSIFSDPNNFNITRKGAKHLAFSYGIHYCIGAAMAKMEVAVVLETLLSKYKYINKAGKAQRVQNTTIRGFTKLPLRFS